MSLRRNINWTTVADAVLVHTAEQLRAGVADDIATKHGPSSLLYRVALELSRLPEVERAAE